MSQERQKEPRWTVQRRFESNRLSQVTLERAYAILMPPYALVLRVPTGATEEPWMLPENTAPLYSPSQVGYCVPPTGSTIKPMCSTIW